MSKEHFKIGNTVYIVKNGIIVSSIPHIILQKKDGHFQIENTLDGFKSWWKGSELTKKLTTIKYKLDD